MQAVLLSAGQSSRFHPFGTQRHKSMIELMGKPLIAHTIERLQKIGIKELIIVVDPKSEAAAYLGDGRQYGVRISYIIQNEPKGAGDALLLAKDIITSDFLLLNSYHVDADLLVPLLLKKRKKKADTVILAREKKNPWDHGVVLFEEGKLSQVIEKPEKGKEISPYCIVGVYLFSQEFLKELEITPSGHYRLETAIGSFAKSRFVQVVTTEANTTTLKYPWDLLEIKDYLFKSLTAYKGKNTEVAKSAELIGEVHIDDNAKIMEGAKIKGPCYIGKNATVGNNAIIRNGVDVGEGSVVGANLEIKNSVLMKQSETHSGFIGDSVIGQNCKIAAGFCTANVRLDRGEVQTVVKGKKVPTGQRHLGVFMGDSVIVGIASSVMPGVVIGEKAVIGPSTVVLQNVAPHTKYYTKFLEIVEKKMTRKKIVLLDIDYTLFDVDYFDKQFYKKLEPILGIAEETIREASIRTIKALVASEHFLDVGKYLGEFLNQLGEGGKIKVVEHVLFGSGFFKGGFYGDIKSAVSELATIARVGVFSQGDLKLQGAKIQQSGIEHLFDKEITYIIKPRKIDFLPLLKAKHKQDEVYLVDDKQSILKEVKKIVPDVFCIWINRGRYAKEEKIDNFHPDAIIGSLSEVFAIVNKK